MHILIVEEYYAYSDGIVFHFLQVFGLQIFSIIIYFISEINLVLLNLDYFLQELVFLEVINFHYISQPES